VNVVPLGNGRTGDQHCGEVNDSEVFQKNVAVLRQLEIARTTDRHFESAGWSKIGFENISENVTRIEVH
jgi:hypothetical protein